MKKIKQEETKNVRSTEYISRVCRLIEWRRTLLWDQAGTRFWTRITEFFGVRQGFG